MSLKTNIIRILLLSLWVLLSAGVLVLLIAASNIKNNKTCKGIEIAISGVEEYVFLDDQDILKLIAREGISNPKGKALAGFKLRHLEALLKRNVWVKEAELFFDNNLVLHINIHEREPVARIFTKTGSSFYIDSSGYKMPLSDKMSVRLPVFTGFPTDKLKLKSADSLLMEHIKKVAYYILRNEFWMAQIAQVDILPDKNFEMMPTVGNHIIQFGNGENFRLKFRSLLVFYKQVLSRAGFDKYSRLNVQFSKQLVATKKGTVTKIDSVRALNNIEKLIMDARAVTEDSIFTSMENNIAGSGKNDSANNKRNAANEIVLKNHDTMKQTDIRINQPALVSPSEKQSPTTANIKPKAVMRKID